MTFPVPIPGLVIRYSYLWRREHERGREEGSKDRPCAVLLSVVDAVGELSVVVLPITHSPPRNEKDAVELPATTKQRLGLDEERAWIVLTEANRFNWPGPDLRPRRRGDAASVVYGELPGNLFRHVRDRWLDLAAAQRSRVTSRTE